MNQEMRLFRKRVAGQEGMALVVAVVVLMALTIIGLSAVYSSNLSIDVSSNIKARTTAYHAAEACMYYQIRRIKTSGSATTAMNYSLQNGLSCSAGAPTYSGSSSGAGVLNGYSLESGAATLGYVSYKFNVTGTGHRNTITNMTVGVKLPSAGGGY